MKKIVTALTIFILVSAHLNAQQYALSNLIGSWRNRKGAGLDVVDSNTIYIVYGGKRMQANTSKADFSQNPVWLDLQVKSGQQTVTFKSLLRFLNDNTLQWQVFDAVTKPARFSEVQDMFFLKRIEPLSN